MKRGLVRSQRGVALIITLIVLSMGSLLIVPTLQYATTALKTQGFSRNDLWTQYALDAFTQHALWELEYDDQFQDCVAPLDGLADSFLDCVIEKGEWTLTTQPLPVGTPHTVYSQVNGRDVSVTVTVPGDLVAPPEPTPTITPAKCLYAWVTRDTDLTKAGDQTWVQVGQPIYYSVHVWNCSSGPAAINLRRIIALLPAGFTYVTGSSVGDMTVLDPEVSVCDGAATVPDPDYTYCAAVDNSLLTAWQSATENWGGSGTISIALGETKVHTFAATPGGWGVFHIEVTVCYFDASSGDPGPCTAGNQYKTGKVAPVVVGMFNIQGKGKGNAFGASSKLDSGGSDIISVDPQ